MKTEGRPGYLLVLPWDLTAIGGVTSVVANLYEALEADGRFEPHLLVVAWDAPTPRYERDADSRSVIRLRVRCLTEGRPVFLDALKYLAALPSQLWRLWRLVKQLRIAVVNCHYIGSSELTWVLARKLKLYRGKLIVSTHGLDVRTLAKLTGLQRGIWRWTLRQVDAIVGCSQTLSDETREVFDLPAGLTVTIHNGVDVARIARLATSNGHPQKNGGGPALLNLATFEHKKGHDVLVAAFQLVLERYPEARLTIMGRRSGTAEATAQSVRDLGLSDRVTLHMDAPHDAAMHALGATDLFVLSSRNEGFAIVLLEAGALGRPIVATNVCGVTELIEDGVTGIVVPPDNPKALAEGILRALADSEAAAARARRLHDVVTSRFTTAATWRRYLELAAAP